MLSMWLKASHRFMLQTVIYICVESFILFSYDRRHCFQSGNILKTEGGQIHLNLVTAL